MEFITKVNVKRLFKLEKMVNEDPKLNYVIKERMNKMSKYYRPNFKDDLYFHGNMVEILAMIVRYKMAFSDRIENWIEVDPYPCIGCRMKYDKAQQTMFGFANQNQDICNYSTTHDLDVFRVNDMNGAIKRLWESMLYCDRTSV